MKLLRLTLLPALLACTLTLSAEEKAPTEAVVFRAVLSMGEQQMFSLSNLAGENARWVNLGDTYLGQKVHAYDAATQTLTLHVDGKPIQVALASSTFRDTDAVRDTLKQAQDLVALFSLKDVMLKSLGATLKPSIDQTLAQSGKAGSPGLSESILKDVIALYEAELDWEKLDGVMVEAYSEVFTSEELAAYIQFQSSPAGRASLEKAPAVQAKIMEHLMPEMMRLNQQLIPIFEKALGSDEN